MYAIKTGNRFVGPALAAVGLAFLLMLAGRHGSEADGQTKMDMGEAIGAYIAEVFEDEIMGAFVPTFAFVEEDMDIWQTIMTEQITAIMPLYHFKDSENEAAGNQMTIEMILREEAKEHNITDDQSDETSKKLSDETSNKTGEQETEGRQENEEDKNGKENRGSDALGDLAALFQAENEAAKGSFQNDKELIEDHSHDIAYNGLFDFIPHTKVAEVDLNALRDYETLVQSFYTIDSSTMIGSDQLNVENLSGKDMSIDKNADGPQILIYHTHSQEAFADSVAGDRSTTIVGVGDYLTGILTEKYGYQVLHHDGEYDVPSRDDAYSVALPAITQILEENPTIQVVIDLHRDAMDESTHLVTEIDGKPTARFMFFNGLSRTRKTGNISYLYNANLNDNLAFSFQLQKTAMEYYPGLTRKIYLKAYRYNMHLRPRSLLIELGAQNNTVEEAMNACEPMAHILDMVLSGSASTDN